MSKSQPGWREGQGSRNRVNVMSKALKWPTQLEDVTSKVILYSFASLSAGWAPSPLC